MMKFDFVIGNPPYQLETAKKETENGQKTQTNIFQYFQLEADKVVDEASVLIYPAKRWIHQSGKGLNLFGKGQINDTRLKQLVYFENAREVFKESDISDGISIVLKKQNKKTNGFEYIYIRNGAHIRLEMDNPGDDLMPLNPSDFEILRKVDDFVKNNGFSYVHDRILPRSLFGIESDFVQNNPTLVRPFTSDFEVDFPSEVKLFTNDRAGKAGRAKWFVISRNEITTNKNYIDEWQVIVSSANAGGQKRDNQIEIVDNHSAFGRVRVALKSFKTYEEAHNFFKYATSKLIKYTFLMTDESLTSLAKRVPDIIDYSDKQPLIDFGRDIDEQLCQLMQITNDEFAYIQSIVK